MARILRTPLALLLLALLAAVSVDHAQARVLRGGGSLLAACSCISLYDPVCVRNGTQVATNAACALCDERLRGVSYRKEWCVENEGAKDDREEERNSESDEWEVVEIKEEEDFCACAAVYDPVCDINGTVVASNEGCADCDKSLVGVSYSKEWCRSPQVDVVQAGPELKGDSKPDDETPAGDDDICMCTMQYAPVCDENGTVVASNAGCALCDKSLVGVAYSMELCDMGESVLGGRPGAVPPPGSSDAPKPTVTSEKKKVEPSLGEQRAGDVVDDCICPAVFKPVCNKNGTQVASNACLARCRTNLPPTEYSENWCASRTSFVPLVVPRLDNVVPTPVVAPKVKTTTTTPPVSTQKDDKPSVGGDQICICPMNYDPYCRADGAEVAANSCEVSCYGFDFTSVTKENCYTSRGRRLQEPKEECLARCSAGEPQVCDLLGRNLGTACQATCKQGGREGVFSHEYCEASDSVGQNAEMPVVPPPVNAGKEPPTKICICPLVFSPVCTSDGVEVGDNPCDAECRGHSPDTFSGSYCGRDVYESHNALPSSPPSSVSLEPAGWFDTPCSCPESNYPVCAKDGTVVGSSACHAECDGLKRGVDFRRGWCSSGASYGDDSGHDDTDSRGDDDDSNSVTKDSDEAFGDCECPDFYSPVCLENGLYVAANACFARCYRLSEGLALRPCSSSS